MGLSIRAKIVLAIGGPLFAAYILLVFCEYHYGKQHALENMEIWLTELAGRQSTDLNAELTSAEQLVRTLAITVGDLPDLKAVQLESLLQKNLQANHAFYGMCMAFEPNAIPGAAKNFAPYFCRDGRDAHGRLKLRQVDIAAASPDYRNLSWYGPAKANHLPFWTEPYFDTGVGERIMCTFTSPILRQGRFIGVVTVDLLSDDLLKNIANVKIGSGYCMLISKKGTFISHPNTQLVLHESIFGLSSRLGITGLADAGERMEAGKTGVQKIRDYNTGWAKWMIFTPIEATGWSLAVIVPEHEVMRPIYIRIFRVFGIPMAGALAAILIIFAMSARITRPLNQLVEAAESLGSGNLDAHVPDVQGRDEVAKLSQTFNRMTVELKSNIASRIREESARRTVEAELCAARQIQESLFPAPLPPKREQGFELMAANSPAKLVAGDFYDFFFVDEHRLAIVVADVSGKGVPAAMYMAVTRTKLRDFTAIAKTPGTVLDEVNRSLVEESDNGMFVTLFLGYFDTKTGELIYASAGHNAPYVLRNHRRPDRLESTGPVLAAFDGAEFADARTLLQPGETVVLFTDGITEAGMRDREPYGEKRFGELLAKLAPEPVATICRESIQAAADYSDGDLADDATILVVRRTA